MAQVIWMRAYTVDHSKDVVDAVEKANFRNLGHAINSIARDARQSIKRSSEPSEPGSPPHTRGRNFLRRAIRVAYDKESAVAGPVSTIVGRAGEAHEFGGRYRGNEYPERPFMGPALTRATPRLAGRWEGSVGR